MKPDFITFTGADDNTDIALLRALSAAYPIEWGILFSPTRQGRDRRYPSAPMLNRLYDSGLTMSAHLCGGYSRAIMEDQVFPPSVPTKAFQRVQVNHPAPVIEHVRGSLYGSQVRAVAQCGDPAFPSNTDVDWLFDQSGGRGTAPKRFPPYPGRFVGYAGGIGPDNVKTVLGAIAATGSYWIDMESGVRTNDWFDLARVRKVCEEVYG